ncbi:MAG: ArsR/SmtB family transcription factor [Aureispira sp.]
METQTVIIDEDKLEYAAEVMRALTHDLRLQILAFIDKNTHINVNKIYNTLGLEQSITSQHLRILRLANIVTHERRGKQIFYSVNYEYLHNVVGDISNFLSRI